MNRYLEFYIKFQGYAIAVVSMLMSVFITVNLVWRNDDYYSFREFYDVRYMGHMAVIFGLMWLLVGAMMFYGVHKGAKIFLYPFIVLFMFDLFLMFCRDMYLIWSNAPYYEIDLLTPEGGTVAFVITMHITTTMLALGKLIRDDSQTWGKRFMPSRSEGPYSERTYNEVFGHDAAVVTE